MTTTALLIEFFIIGLQALIWIFLLVIIIFGINWIPNFDFSKIFSPSLIIMLAPISYPLGLFIDEIADFLLQYPKIKIKAKYITDNQSGFDILYTSNNDWAIKYLEYLRLKIRISRSSIFNFFILFLLLFILVNYKLNTDLGLSKKEFNIIISIVGIVLIFLAYFSWQQATIQFYKRVKKAYDLTTGNSPDNN